MTKIAISGATGRMGDALIKAVLDTKGLQLTAAIARPGSAALGQEAAPQSGQHSTGVRISSDIAERDFDVLVDFTRPEASMAYLGYCRDNNKAMVIGTTGFNPQQLAELSTASASIKIVLASNMSVGVNLSFKLLQMAARAIGEEADIEIIEAHHKHKVDAPSGTALAMGNVIADELDIDLDRQGVFARHGHTGERQPGQVGFSVIRAGDIIGEHTVMFALHGERIEITHKASSRSIYATGALRAAKWLSQQSGPGLYNMQNVLGLT